MCIYNFTDLTNFNKTIYRHSKRINQHSVIGCLIYSDSLSQMMPIKKKYSFIVIHKDNHDLEMYILLSENKITRETILEMLDCFDEYLDKMSN